MTSSQTSIPTLQECKTCGGGAPVDVHFCPQCTKILTLGRHGDYFTFLGVPRKLHLDVAGLEHRFWTLSRQFHPDYFYNADPIERRASLERSSYLNDAYRTLKNPIARVDYLLQLEGIASRSSHEAGKLVPQGLLEEVFTLNEELDEIRELRVGGAPEAEWRARLERAQQPIERKRDAHEAALEDLSARWDALVDAGADAAARHAVLEALHALVLERTYIDNLLAGIDRELNA